MDEYLLIHSHSTTCSKQQLFYCSVFCWSGFWAGPVGERWWLVSALSVVSQASWLGLEEPRWPHSRSWSFGNGCQLGCLNSPSRVLSLPPGLLAPHDLLVCQNTGFHYMARGQKGSCHASSRLASEAPYFSSALFFWSVQVTGPAEVPGWRNRPTPW